MGNDNVRRKRICVKTYKLKDLAGIYEVSLYYMRKFIFKHKKAVGKREGHYYSTEQVSRIFKLVQLPSHVEIVQTFIIGTLIPY